MRVTWDYKKSNAYEAVENIVLKKYGYLNDSIVVQLRTKYKCEGEDEWHDITDILLFDKEYIWESDWWEGEQDVELIAAAPVAFVTLGNEWRFDEHEQD